MPTEQAIDEFLQSRLAQNLKPTSVDWYRYRLERFARVVEVVP